jgi:S1-C subfamily serine protease
MECAFLLGYLAGAQRVPDLRASWAPPPKTTLLHVCSPYGHPGSTGSRGTMAAVTGGGWGSTVEKVLPAVVVLKAWFRTTFDGDEAMYTEGTGFVVDMERGIILTNRHLSGPGPVTARAVFRNKEELSLEALYWVSAEGR